jgi:hypothetical protein
VSQPDSGHACLADNGGRCKIAGWAVACAPSSAWPPWNQSYRDGRLITGGIKTDGYQCTAHVRFAYPFQRGCQRVRRHRE